MFADVAMQEHVKGQRHKQLESAAEGERLRTERSVYVRGFEAGVTTCKLHEHFGAFGRVQNVYLDKEKVGASNLFDVYFVWGQIFSVTPYLYYKRT